MNDAKVKAAQAMSVSERKAEEMRQSQIMADAINDVICSIGKTFETPMMNAVAGAILSIEAGILASCDPQGRKILRKAMAAARPEAFANAMTKSNPKVVNVMVRRYDA